MAANSTDPDACLPCRIQPEVPGDEGGNAGNIYQRILALGSEAGILEIQMVPKGKRLKMILLLMVMTPGIPEYLTGSTPFYKLVFDFPAFLLGLSLNLGLYSTGALLIREFGVRFRKGWASILILGCAYGIMEEGISVHTFFQASGEPVGLLAVYGRYAGVNWIWALGLTFFHAIFSIALPLVLLSLAYPEHSKEPLLGRKGAATVLCIYASDVILLNLILQAVQGKSVPSAGEYLFFLILSALLVVSAYYVPGHLLSPRGESRKGTNKFYLLGLLVFPLYTLYAYFPVRADGTGRIPPILDMTLFVAGYAAIMVMISRYMPPESNDREKAALAYGLVTPLLVWAELMELIGMGPMITVVTVIALVFLLKLRSMVGQRAAALPGTNQLHMNN